MSEKTLLSILVPTYNRYMWLQQCLQSILPYVLNLNDCIEVIVGNNASIDGSHQLQHAFSYSALRWIDFTDHVPMKQNWDRLVSHANGEWILLLSDDDQLLPMALPRVFPALMNPHNHIVIGSCIIDKYTYRYSELRRLKISKYETLSEFLNVPSDTRTSCLCATFIRRTALCEVGGFSASPFDLACDADQILEIARRFGGIETSNVLVSRYAIQPSSLTIQMCLKALEEARALANKWKFKNSAAKSPEEILTYEWRYKLYAASVSEKLQLIPKAIQALQPLTTRALLQIIMAGLGFINCYTGCNRMLCRLHLVNTKKVYWWSSTQPPPLEIWPQIE